MKKPNLENAPTMKELVDSKFTRTGPNDFYIQLNAQTTLNVRFIFLECEIFLESNKKNKLSLSPTKQIINDVVNLYGEGHQVNFVWNQSMPKCGQVWSQKITQVCDGQKSIGQRDVLITKMNNLKNICYFILDDKEQGSSSMKTFLKVSEKKAETLKEYFMKDVAFCENIKIEELKTEQVPMSYNYKELKKLNKLDFFLAGKDHDSFDAFKKLHQVREFVNSHFKPCEDGLYYSVVYDVKKNKLFVESEGIDIKSGLIFNSYQAAEQAMKHNEYLFLSWLKVNNS